VCYLDQDLHDSFLSNKGLMSRIIRKRSLLFNVIQYAQNHSQTQAPGRWLFSLAFKFGRIVWGSVDLMSYEDVNLMGLAKMWNNQKLRVRSYCAVIMIGIFLPVPSWALEPHEILVLANRNAARSVGLAKYYMEKRGIPEECLLQLWVTDGETCEREDYEKKILAPIRKFFRETSPAKKIKCVLIMYGLPLRVLPPQMTKEERVEAEELEKRQGGMTAQLAGISAQNGEERQRLRRELETIEKRVSSLRKADQGASLDSEIALALREEYPLSGWIPNPFFAGYRGREVQAMRASVLLVSRLDGPSDEIVRRVIDQSIETEKNGLKGKAYFDARWPKPQGEKKEKGISYELYDRSIHLAAERVKKSTGMPVIINDEERVFQPGECPDAALYCGWYSLARYVDAFQWRPGSVGYHIASSECQTLKQPGSEVWCKRMLERGVAATLGPVSEPYVQAFPVPEMFFSFLLDGNWTLAECYALSQPFWSWQMVLLGDPLYRPFRQKN
jgi:uncharacterized protein (TIGR03790 family)